MQNGLKQSVAGVVSQIKCRRFWLGLSVLLVTASAAGIEPILIVTNMDTPPYISEQSLNGGLHTEIVKEAFKAGGLEANIRLMPWKRAFRELEDGHITASYSWAYSPERAEKFVLSVSMFSGDNTILTTLPDIKVWTDIEERAEGSTVPVICLPLGWKMYDGLKKMVKRGVLKHVEPANVRSCIELLLVGRVHVLYVPRLTALYYLDELKKKEGSVAVNWPKLYEIPGPEDNDNSVHVMFARTEAGQRACIKFDSGFLHIVESGLYRKILDKHLAPYSKSDKSGIYRMINKSGILDAEPVVQAP